MTTAEHTLAGRLHGLQHRLPVRIYWEDTDGGGIVYHANYLKFMERGRSDYLRLLHIHQHELLSATGVSLVVGRMEIDFRRSARLDDVVEVVTQLTGLGGASIQLDQSIWRGEDVLVQARVTVAAVKNGKATRLPPAIRHAFESAVQPAV